MKQALLDYALKRDNFIGDWKHSNDNEVLFFFHKVVELAISGESIAEFKPLLKNFNDSTRVKSGIFKRAPKHSDMNSHDNILGICLASIYLDEGETAREIAHAGFEHGWCFNNRNPKQWEMRAQLMLADHTIVLLAAGYKLHPLDTIICGINMLTSKTGNMFRCRGLILEKALQNRTNIPSAVLKVFWGVAKLRWPKEKIVERLKRYYGNPKPDPVVNALMDASGGRWSL